jgi:hypothetical protein
VNRILEVTDRSKLSETTWVMLPMYIQSHVRSYLREKRPRIKGLQYHWDRHLTPEGRFKVLKDAGVD